VKTYGAKLACSPVTLWAVRQTDLLVLLTLSCQYAVKSKPL